MVVYQQDVDTGLYIAVLEGIVQQDDVDVLVVLHQRVNAMTAVLVNCYDDIRIFLLHLEGFVTNLWHRSLCCGLYETAALALIASTEHSCAEGVFQ